MRPNNVCLFVQDKVAVKLQVGVYTIPPFLMLSVTPGPGLVGSRFNVASLSNQACFRYHVRPCFVVSSLQSSGPRMLTVPACQLHLTPLVCLVFKQPSCQPSLAYLSVIQASSSLCFGFSMAYLSDPRIVLNCRRRGRGSPNYLKDHHKSAMLLPPTATASHHPPQSSAPNGKRAKLSTRLRL